MISSSESDLDSYDSSSAVERKVAYGNRRIISLTPEFRSYARERRYLHKLRKQEKKRALNLLAKSAPTSARMKRPLLRREREPSDSDQENEGLAELKKFARRKMRPSAFSEDSDVPNLRMPTLSEPYPTLKRVDPLFTGCLTDFRLGEPELEESERSCPPLPEEFREGAVVATRNMVMLEAFRSLQLGVRYQIAAYRYERGSFQERQVWARRGLALSMHALSRTHLSLIEMSAEASEEQKARAILRDYVPRDARAYLEDPAFFRAEARSGELPGRPTPPAARTPSTPASRAVSTPVPPAVQLATTVAVTPAPTDNPASGGDAPAPGYAPIADARTTAQQIPTAKPQPQPQLPPAVQEPAPAAPPAAGAAAFPLALPSQGSLYPRWRPFPSRSPGYREGPRYGKRPFRSRSPARPATQGSTSRPAWEQRKEPRYPDRDRDDREGERMGPRSRRF
jgi:hypothetical protein